MFQWFTPINLPCFFRKFRPYFHYSEESRDTFQLRYYISHTSTIICCSFRGRVAS